MEGVKLAGGSEDELKFVGGVLDLEGSCAVVDRVDIRSGDRFGGVGCGMVVSKSSERRRVEKVRFASSAACCQLEGFLRVMATLCIYLLF